MTKKETATEYDYFATDGLDPRKQVTEWVKLKEKIGNTVTGRLLSWWEHPGNPGYADQISVAIEGDDGVVRGISVATYFREQLETSVTGDRVAFRYEGDKDTGKPQPLKVINYYNKARLEREKTGSVQRSVAQAPSQPEKIEYPEEDIDPNSIPF